MLTDEVFQTLKEEISLRLMNLQKEINDMKECITKIDYLLTVDKITKSDMDNESVIKILDEILEFLKPYGRQESDDLVFTYFDGGANGIKFAYNHISKNHYVLTKYLKKNMLQSKEKLKRILKEKEDIYDKRRIHYNYISSKGIINPVRDINGSIVEVAKLLEDKEISLKRIYQIVAAAIHFNATYYIKNTKKFSNLPQKEQETMLYCINLNNLFNEQGEVRLNTDLINIINNLDGLFDDERINKRKEELNYTRYNINKNSIIAYYYGTLLKVNSTVKEELPVVSSTSKSIDIKNKKQLQIRRRNIELLKEYYDGENIIKPCDLSELSEILEAIDFEDAYKNSILKKMKLYLNTIGESKIPPVLRIPYQIDMYKIALDRSDDPQISSILNDIAAANELYFEADISDKGEILLEINSIFSLLANKLQIDEDEIKLRYQKGDKN